MFTCIGVAYEYRNICSTYGIQYTLLYMYHLHFGITNRITVLQLKACMVAMIIDRHMWKLYTSTLLKA